MTAKPRPIWEVMLDNVQDISAEEFALLPPDGASQLDHYLCGHPKRDQRASSSRTPSSSAGLKLYRARLDKGYSLTDCISVETMRREGIADALANDAHFEQEGFRAISRR